MWPKILSACADMNESLVFESNGVVRKQLMNKCRQVLKIIAAAATIG